jgi:hypothetical protein
MLFYYEIKNGGDGSEVDKATGAGQTDSIDQVFQFLLMVAPAFEEEGEVDGVEDETYCT